MQLELLNTDEGQAIISIQIDNGIRTNIVRRSKEIGEIVKTEITDINLIVSTNTSRKISNGVITGTVPEHEEVIAPPRPVRLSSPAPPTKTSLPAPPVKVWSTPSSPERHA